MLGLPGMKARNRTPCLALSIRSKTSARSGGVGGAFVFERGTDFCVVFGENQTRTLPFGFLSSSTRSWASFSFLSLSRKILPCRLVDSPSAALVSFFSRFQYVQ